MAELFQFLPQVFWEDRDRGGINMAKELSKIGLGSRPSERALIVEVLKEIGYELSVNIFRLTKRLL